MWRDGHVCLGGSENTSQSTYGRNYTPHKQQKLCAIMQRVTVHRPTAILARA